MADDVMNEVHRDREGVLHHDGVHEGQIRAGSGPHCPADRIDLVRDLLRAARGRPLIEQLGDELAQTTLSFWILRRTRSHEQTHRHGRLLVMSCLLYTSPSPRD